MSSKQASLFTKWLGKKKTVKQIIREQKRENNKAIRELDREVNRMKREQNKAEIEMRKLAKQGQMQAVRHMAKDVVRMKDTQTKYFKLKCELRALSAAMVRTAATAQLHSAMSRVSRTLGVLSKQIKFPQLQASLQQYMQQCNMMETKTEMIDDALDDALDHDEDAENEEIQKVMDAIGLDMGKDLVDAPGAKSNATEENDIDDDLQKRLDKLRS